MPKVVVVTDSTASLPREVLDEHGILVVPLSVVLGAHCYVDGVDPEVSPERLTAALREFVPVSTSRPSPAAVLEVYRQAAAAGAEEIVSVHVSGESSATFESALMAARDSPVPVHPVDTRLVGAGTGFAALAAAAAAAAGADGETAARAAAERASRTTTLFYVDTLEYLRRGGRVGAAAALVGSALAVKPILQVVDGRVGAREKVRTAGRALARLEELAVEAALAAPAGTGVDVAVLHLSNGEVAQRLADSLAVKLEEALQGKPVHVGEVGAALGAHVGPGLVGVVVAPR